MTQNILPETNSSRGTPVSVPVPQPTWRIRLSNWFFGVKPADTIFHRRAIDLTNKLQMADYIKPSCTYVDIGAGIGHNAAQIARLANGLDARVVCVEPVSKPTKRVLQRMRNRTDTAVQFVRAVGNRLPLATGIADGTCIFFVLHHIPYEISTDGLGRDQTGA